MTTRRNIIKAVAGLSLAPVAAVAKTASASRAFGDFTLQKIIWDDDSESPTPIGIGAKFVNASGDVMRQAVRIRRGASPQEFGKALEILAKFFQSPDDRARCGDVELNGNELNAVEAAHTEVTAGNITTAELDAILGKTQAGPKVWWPSRSPFDIRGHAG